MNHQNNEPKLVLVFVSNKRSPSVKSDIYACISSRITTVIHVVFDFPVNDNCYNEPFAVSPYKGLYLDMHGLIFETSIWLLAGSTRWLSIVMRVQLTEVNFRNLQPKHLRIQFDSRSQFYLTSAILTCLEQGLNLE